MLGWQEVVLIFAMLLFVFGPTQLPKIARELGKAMREFNNAASGLREEFEKTSSGLTKTVRSASTRFSESPSRSVARRKRDKALSDIAEKLNVTTEGKTEEQITQEIIAKIEKRDKASNTKTEKR
ncbi:twin-arginine translocase TatA/TatE family subunit [Candidatus Bathyarchaeota archaeon]|nr:twin-arginine translocase TatA/TatE family subunit [Candidatus Bathyarchaeota archaeon]